MTTLTVVLINVHAYLIFFCQFQFLTNQRKFEQDRFQKFQKFNLLYLHCRTHFTKVILAKIL
jgi:hypothetical protein